MKLAKPIIVLTLICLISSALLGLTYEKTKDIIAAAELQATNDAMAEVLPGSSGDFEQLDAGMENVLMAAKDNGGAGYVFQVEDSGYGGAYVVMVGMDNEGTITGAKLLEHNETPGLGAKTEGADFTSQFIGKNQSSAADVDMITGATISSSAFIRCVEAACEAFNAVQ